MHWTLTRRMGVFGRPTRGARRWRFVAATIAVSLAVASLASAQVLYGTITGQVTDTTGGALPGATVAAVNTGTGVSKTATADERGTFTFADLVPGAYDVTFQLSGFRTTVHRGVRVETNTVRRVDASLELTTVSESVEVVASAAVLQTDRADMITTQTAEQVNNLPLTGSLGRNYQSLMQVVPGASIVRSENGQGEANSVAGSPQRSISFTANGVSGWNNITRIDGSPAQYVWLPTNTAYVPSPEAIEEVSIVTNSYTAEVGMAGGAAINVVVKSGSNAYRGTGWVYDTDAEWRARNPFQTAVDNPKNVLKQYGANHGGRVVRDRLFYFFNVERTTQEVGAGSRLLSIAPASLRPNAAGDVVFPTAEQGGATIYDPASNPNPALRTPFPNNTIPAARIDQAARYLIGKLPATTGPGFTNNIETTGALNYERTNYDLKLNYATPRLNVFGRYGNSPHLIDDQYALGDAGGGSSAGGSVGLAVGRTQILGLGTTYVIGPTMLFDANFGLTHQVLGAEAPDLDVKVGSGSDKLNIPGTNGPDRLQGGLPSFQIANWANLGNDGTGNPFNFRDNQYSFNVNLQKQFSAHRVRGGVEWLDQQINHFQPQGGTFQTVRGTFIFNGQSTMLQNAPAPADTRFNSWAAFLLGLPSQAGKVDQLLNPNSLYMTTWAAYAQDTWQVGDKLTVAYGLRWEHQLWPRRPDGLGVNRFDPADGFVYIGGAGNTPQDTGASTEGMFLPRLGATYRIDDKTVLRGGYALGADNTSFVNFRNAYPAVFAWQMPVVQIGGVDNPYLPVTTLRQGLVVPGGAPDTSSGRILLPQNVGATTFAKQHERGKVHSFNITVQREIARWLTGQASYVGTRANGQMNFVNVNAAAPGTGNAGRPLVLAGLTNVNSDINVYSPYGDTVYDGLQTSVKARAHGALIDVAYTWSKTTNYVDHGGGNAAGAGGPRIQYLPEKERNKGLAGYNRTHNLQVWGVYDLPFGPGGRWATSGAPAWILDGWSLNGIWSAMSGTPIYIVQNTGFNLNAPGSQQIPDLIADSVATFPDNLKNRPPAGDNGNGYQYFDRSAYAVVNIPAGQTQRFGTSPRNTVRGPGFWNVDLGLFRRVEFSRYSAQFRLEVLNVFNHHNYANPGNNISDPATFGFITNTVGVGERNVRLGFRVTF
jgi:hypothetical protein